MQTVLIAHQKGAHMDLKELAKILQVEQDFDAIEIKAISIDSRTIKPGSCYFAIQGEVFDGHDFVADAVKNGASAAVVERQMDVDIPQIIVSDTIKALGRYAQHHRQQFTPFVVALTGSCGKTTVKEMIASIFKQVAKTYATSGNFNNHIGVPLSLLQLTAEHEYAVFELGASGAGEIAYTASLVEPKITLINNVSAAHIQGFGSLAGVASAKGEIYEALPNDGVACVNIDDEFADSWLSKIKNQRVVTFSLDDETAQVTAHSVILDKDNTTRLVLVTPDGQVALKLPLPGKHNVRNAIAAAAMAYAAGCPLDKIAAGLEHVTQVKGRMNLRRGKSGARIYDDTYNANPSSVKAAIDTLGTYSGKRILILGEMAELGDNAAQYHHEVGEYAKSQGVDKLFTVGPLTQHACEGFGEDACFYPEQSALVEGLMPVLNEEVTCVVKGSRSARMENIVDAICE